jgi:integral membrane sensor domain MASE1
MIHQMLDFFRARRPAIRHIAAYILKILLIAIVYHLAARLGLRMAYVQINTSPVWPPTGIALAALLIFGYEVWPAISLGVLLGSLFTGADTWVALGITLGNTLEALAGAYLLRRFVNFHNAMDRVQDVTGLALVSLLSAAIRRALDCTLTDRESEWSGSWLWSTW